MIRNIRIDLDVADADCRLNNIVLMHAFTPEGKVLPKTRSQWRKLHLQGWVDYCNSATRLLAVGSQPEEPGTITMSVALLKQADNAHLRGFEITPAGAPDRISRP